MNTEQKFINLIKEGKVSDAMQSIKEALTNMAGESVVEQKFAVAEQYGLKRVEEKKDDDDEDFEDDDKEDKDKEPASKDDDESEDDDDKKDK